MIETLLGCIADAGSLQVIELVCERVKVREAQLRTELSAAELDLARLQSDLEDVRCVLARAAELYDQARRQVETDRPGVEPGAGSGGVPLRAH